MKPLKNIELIDLALYTNNVLVLTDFHVGYEEALNKQGVFVPRFQFKEIIDRLDNIFKKLEKKKIQTIVIAGDLKHEFGQISDQEWRHTLKLLDYFSKKCEHIVLLKGNHDTILGPIAQKRNVSVVDYFLIDGNEQYVIQSTKKEKKESVKQKLQKSLNKKSQTEITKRSLLCKNNSSKNKEKILVVHGDIIPSKEILVGVKTIIMGHEHPAVSIHDTQRSEKFKCFLIGKWEKQNLIVIPSFNLVTEGTDVIKQRLLSPFLKKNVEKFKAIVVADTLYDFGKISKL